jgi:hypothetical protein
MHPLANDLSVLKDDELHHKYGELQKRMIQAYKFGPQAVIPQLQMIMGDYQAEISRRNQKQMDELMAKTNKDGKNNGIIDIS